MMILPGWFHVSSTPTYPRSVGQYQVGEDKHFIIQPHFFGCWFISLVLRTAILDG